MSQFLGFSVLFGALLAFLISIGRLLRAPKNLNSLIVAPLMFTVALWQGHTGLLVSHYESDFTDLLSFLLLPASLAFLPLYHAYGNRILSPEYEIRGSFSWALFLFCLGLVLEAIGIFLLKKELLIELIFALSGFSRVMTILLSLRLIGIAIHQKKDRKIANQHEIRISIFLLTMTTIIGTSVSLYAQIVGKLRSDLHAAGALFVSITIIILYFLNERNSAFFDLEHRLIRDRKISVDTDKIEQLERVIEKLMKEEAIFRTEELNIAQFTEAVNLEGFKFNQKQISEFINIKFKKNFNVWINEFRMEEACSLLRENRDESILGIAYSVGFNSKSTFNATFKSSMGMTPNEYREKYRI